MEFKNSRQIIRSAERVKVENQREGRKMEVSKLEFLGEKEGKEKDEVSKLEVFREGKLEAGLDHEFHDE